MNVKFNTFSPATLDLRAGRPGVFCVEASAGTGKTFSITGLVLRLICEGTHSVSLDEVLVVTFTRAAAAELRGRIGDRLATASEELEHVLSWLRRDPPTGSQWMSAMEEATAASVSGFVHDWLASSDYLRDDDTRAEVIEEWNRRIRRARERLDSATFATIHSFCQRMLQWHAFEAEEALGSVLIDDPDELRKSITNELVADILEETPEFFLISSVSKPQELSEILMKAMSDSSADVYIPAPAAAKASIDLTTERASFNATLRDLKQGIADLRDSEQSALGAAFEAAKKALTATEFKSFISLRKLGKTRQKGANKPHYVEEFTLMVDQLLNPSVALSGATLSSWVGLIKLFGDKKLTAKKSSALFGPASSADNPSPLQASFQDLAALHKRLSDLSDVIIYESCRFARKKLDQHLIQSASLTFDRMIHATADRIEAEAALPEEERALTNAIRTRYKVALIDEFQDTDQHQWSIFAQTFLHSPKHRLFLIGDPKQAIYAFRGADINTYLQARQEVHHTAKRRLLHARLTDTELERAGLYTMTRNYRSDASIIVALNRMMGALYRSGADHDLCQAPSSCGSPGEVIPGFFDIPNKPTDINYILVDWQHPSPRSADEDCVSLAEPGSRLLIEQSADEQTSEPQATWTEQPIVFRPLSFVDQPDAEPSSSQDSPAGNGTMSNRETLISLMPKMVAADIQALLLSDARIVEATDSPSRRVEANDIAVLVNSWKRGKAIQSQLNRLGIKAIIASGEEVWGSEEARELALVMEAALTPSRRSALVNALCGSIISIPLTELIGLDAEPNLEAWAQQLNRLAQSWAKSGLLTMMSELMSLTIDPQTLAASTSEEHPTVQTRILSRFDGERRLTNLNQLIELIHTESGIAKADPAHQLAHLQTKIAEADSDRHTSGDDPRRERIESDSSAVVITTIHGSKGLEYPFVFLPDFFLKGAGKIKVPGIVPAPPASSGEPWRRILYATKHNLSDAEAVTKAAEEAEQGEGTTAHTADPNKLGSYSPASVHEDLEVEESRRLLYVALTRAKHQAVLYFADWYHNGRESSAESALDPESKHPLRQMSLTRWVQTLPPLLEHGAAAIPADCPSLSGLYSLQTAKSDFGYLALAISAGINPRGEFNPRLSNNGWPTSFAPQERALPQSEDNAPAELYLAELTRQSFFDPSIVRASFTHLTKSAEHVSPQMLREAAEAEERGAASAGAEEHELTEEHRIDAEVAELLSELAPEPHGDDIELPLFESLQLGGTGFGTAIHSLLEDLPFQLARGGEADRLLLQEYTADAMRRHGFQLEARQLASLTADMATFLNAPLGGELGSTALSDIKREHRIDELEFLLPVPEHVTVERLVEAFSSAPPEGATSWSCNRGSWQRWLNTLSDLSFNKFCGQLTGYIDLSFVPRPDSHRFFIVDYKTNRLHSALALEDAGTNYAPSQVVDAMISSHYILQYHLYLVALRRYLISRMGGRFSYDEHIGGTYYPFLRGVNMSPQHDPGEADLRPGIFYDRPPAKRIEALDELFAARGDSHE